MHAHKPSVSCFKSEGRRDLHHNAVRHGEHAGEWPRVGGGISLMSGGLGKPGGGGGGGGKRGVGRKTGG